MNPVEMSEELDMFFYQIGCLDGSLSEDKKSELLKMIEQADALVVQFRESGEEGAEASYMQVTGRIIKEIDVYFRSQSEVL